MFTFRSKTCTQLILPLILFTLPGQSPAANSAASALMSNAMLSMMDAMGNLAQQYNRNRNWSYGDSYPRFSNWQGMHSAPWTTYVVPGTGMPGGLPSVVPSTIPQTAVMPGRVTVAPASPLDGIWQGQGGEIVLVMYGRFRIYADAENYRDGRYEVRNDRIIMSDPESGVERAYEFALNQGRMVLKGKDGGLLLFRQLPIPIPPYSLFAGQELGSADQQAPADDE